MTDLGLFDDDRALARDVEDHHRRRLEEIWRNGRSSKPRRCRSCRAALRWLVTDTGRWMPVNGQPDSAGNVEIEWRGCAQVARVVGPSKDVEKVADLTLRYMPHHATCPAAGRHRSRR